MKSHDCAHCAQNDDLYTHYDQNCAQNNDLYTHYDQNCAQNDDQDHTILQKSYNCD